MRALLVGLLLFVVGCDTEDGETSFSDTDVLLNDDKDGENSYTILYSTLDHSSETSKRITEIRNEREWQSFLTTEPEIASKMFDRELNFAQGKVVGIGIGFQPSTGFDVQTTHVETSDRVTRVFVDVTYNNCAFAGALVTHPYELLYVHDAGLISVVENYVGKCEP